MNELTEAIRAYLHRVAGYNRFVVAVELLLIGLVVWSVMRFLRGTRGARLIKGVALLLASRSSRSFDGPSSRSVRPAS